MEGDECGGELPQEEDLAVDTDTPAATAATGEPSEDPEKVRPRPPSLPPQPPRVQGRLSLSTEAEAWGPEAGWSAGSGGPAAVDFLIPESSSHHTQLSKTYTAKWF